MEIQNLDIQNLPMLIDEWKQLLMISKFGIDEVETKLKILNEEYSFFHDYNPIENITSRVKDPEQIIRKLNKLGVAPTPENAYQYLSDIGGIRVTCPFTEDVYRVASLIQNQYDVKVIKIKDYIKTPKPNGYRSLHMLLQIPVFLSDKVQQVVVEVQLRTISMDLWASIEHKIYYKSTLTIPQELLDKLQECAQRLEEIDNDMYGVKKEIQKYTDKGEAIVKKH